ncbi:MAG: hypothetical protein D6734_12810 [Candidatus Schekmanbacteria bacterium]|nr:MAG: hypothetical protein D6734_12810 [Candidatus Schekmanbacteria bacterium]
MKFEERPVKKSSIKRRKNLVSLKNFAQIKKENKISSLLDSFPDILGARSFKKVVDQISKSVKRGNPVYFAMGAHVIKCGLSPYVISLIKNGVIAGVAMNGAGAVHDYEISLIGATSEDVAEGLEEGEFGMAKETSDALRHASEKAAKEKKGFGEALGELIVSSKNKYSKMSILAESLKAGVPATVHVAIGTDIVHMDPLAKGADIGEASLKDFRILAERVSQLEGGVWINMGSAVVLPEVFLKAITLCRNKGYKVDKFLAVNIDMLPHYRPLTNVIKRPTARGGEGINLISQYEILFPLLYFALREKLGFKI